jgi:hypothetical protein
MPSSCWVRGEHVQRRMWDPMTIRDYFLRTFFPDYFYRINTSLLNNLDCDETPARVVSIEKLITNWNFRWIDNSRASMLRDLMHLRQCVQALSPKRINHNTDNSQYALDFEQFRNKIDEVLSFFSNDDNFVLRTSMMKPQCASKYSCLFRELIQCRMVYIDTLRRATSWTTRN